MIDKTVIEEAIAKSRNQTEAQKLLDTIYRLEELKTDYDSPMMVLIRDKIADEIKIHARQVLDYGEPQDTVACKCGERVSVDKYMFHAYHQVWKKIQEVARKHSALAAQVEEKARR